MMAQRFHRILQMRNIFILYILREDTVPLQVALLLTEVANAEIAQDVLQQRLSSIFLSHLMSSALASPSSWAMDVSFEQLESHLKIAPVAEIFSVTGQVQDEVTGASWLDFVKQQISNCKERITHSSSLEGAVCTLSDYSVEFGPYLKGIMTDRTSEVSVQKLHPHLHVASCQVHTLREQGTVVRLTGDNLGFVCHVAIQVSNDDSAHSNTVCTEQFLSPDTWNVRHGFAGSDLQASHADLILQWTAPLEDLTQPRVVLGVQLESVLSDLQEFFVSQGQSWWTHQVRDQTANVGQGSWRYCSLKRLRAHLPCVLL